MRNHVVRWIATAAAIIGISGSVWLALAQQAPAPAAAQGGGRGGGGRGASARGGGPAPAPAAASKPTPRLPDGKPDFSGLWDRPFVSDMTTNSARCGATSIPGCSQTGPGPGQPVMTEWGANWFKSYNATVYDATANCNPLGYMRSINSPVPMQIVQTAATIAFLHEAFFNFHVVYMDGRPHPSFDDANQTTWYGHSTGKWDGDTLVIDTVGPFFEIPMMMLDTRGHPVSDHLHLVERWTRSDYDTIQYEVTIDDPVSYVAPWKNTRVFKLMPPGQEIMEYACTENNKEVHEGLVSTTPPVVPPHPPVK